MTEPLGEFIRLQREIAHLSLRQLSELSDVSNAYLSQVERGMHEPSVRVLRAITEALSLPADTLLREAGLLDQEPQDANGTTASTETAIRTDPALSEAQKDALLTVYRSYHRNTQEDS
jgi:transcriptional regulator with XRE-family HTH domain